MLKNKRAAGPQQEQNHSPATAFTGSKSLSWSWYKHRDPCEEPEGWVSEMSSPLVVLVIPPEQQKLMSL